MQTNWDAENYKNIAKKKPKNSSVRVCPKAQKEEDERVERMIKRLLQVIGEENLEEIMMTDEMEELKQTNTRLYKALQV